MNETDSQLGPVLETYQACLLMLVGFGGLAILLAFLFNYIRARVFTDIDNLDRSFDAGGNVSASLTAVTVAVQLLWPADLLQSASVTAKFGIAGGFWYSCAIVVNIVLFPILSISFKTRAPGAKTYLQVIKARFGKLTHIVYCFFALLTNLVITSVILVAGHALFKSLIKGISNELIFIIMTSLFGSYSFIGGVGSTFYVSYANAVITFLVICYYIFQLFYSGNDDDLPFGSLLDVYNKISQLEGPIDNKDRSYVTFLSLDSMIWMIQGVFVGAAVTFCDQASWQSRIAAKPLQGVLGFFLATFIWFSIPITVGTTSGLWYLAYSDGGTNANSLSLNDIDSGRVTSFIFQTALGDAGGIMLLTVFTMLMMGTGSGEIMGITSIIIYDIYQTYIFPFKKDVKAGFCMLCDKREKGELFRNSVYHEGKYNGVTSHDQIEAMGLDASYCKCPFVQDCPDCQEHLARQEKKQALPIASYRCPIHGKFRHYQDSLIRAKSWVVLGVSLGLVPLGLLLVASGIDLNWIFLTGSVITIHSFPGLVLTIMWKKTRGCALVVGGLVGLLSGITACLIRASTLEGGLSNFLQNTSEGYAVMAGACTSFFVSLGLDVGLSVWTNDIKTEEDEFQEWQKLRDIDNPLRPWKDQFHAEFPDTTPERRPSFHEICQCFRRAKVIAVAGTVISIFIFIFLIPGIMSSMGILTFDQFKGYMVTLQIWTAVMAGIVLVLVPVEEILRIGRQLKKGKDNLRRRTCQILT